MEILHKNIIHMKQTKDHSCPPSLHPSMSLRIIPLFRPDREIGRWIGTAADLARFEAHHQQSRILMKARMEALGDKETPAATGKSGGSSAGRPMKSGLAMLVPGSLVPHGPSSLHIRRREGQASFASSAGDALKFCIASVSVCLSKVRLRFASCLPRIIHLFFLSLSPSPSLFLIFGTSLFSVFLSLSTFSEGFNVADSLFGYC